MKISIEHISDTPIIYMRRLGAYGEQNYILMNTMKKWIHAHNLWNEHGIIYAVEQDNPTNAAPDQCRFDVCYVTDETFDDNSILSGTLHHGTYLVCQIPHTSKDVQSIWKSIPRIASQETKQLDVTRPVLERYQFHLVEQGFCELCIPIL